MSKSFGFSVLGSDVDLDDMLMKKKTEKQPKASTPPPVQAKKTSAKPKPTKKAKEAQSLQALAFGDSKPKKKSQNASSAAQNGAPKQTKPTAEKKKLDSACNGAAQEADKTKLSDEWQTRDQKFVEEVNERDLREAIMLSKLEYEANKDVYEAPAPEQPPPKENSKMKKKKKDKPVTLSLSEFNTMNEKKQPEVKRISNGVLEPSKKLTKTESPKNNNFFSELDSSVRNTIDKEARQKQYAEHLEKQKVNRQSNTGSLLVPVSEVEKRDFEIQALRLEVDSLRDQLERVKLRNKKLCEVMGMAEMRSVSEIVVELEKVSKARDELSSEVASLSEQLEQEKTKVSQLQEKSRKK